MKYALIVAKSGKVLSQREMGRKEFETMQAMALESTDGKTKWIKDRSDQEAQEAQAVQVQAVQKKADYETKLMQKVAALLKEKDRKEGDQEEGCEMKERFNAWDDGQIIGLTLFGEARGENREVQMGVGSVIRNRWRLALQGVAWRKAWNMREIVMWPEQFSCWNEGGGNANLDAILAVMQPGGSLEDKRVMKQCMAIGRGVLGDVWLDETGGADHYHSVRPESDKWPTWAEGKFHTRTIGGIKFYKLLGREREQYDEICAH